MTQTASFPAGALTIYEYGADTSVGVIGVGQGQVVTLSFDWYNAAPVGDQDAGWLDVLDSAISRAAAAQTIEGTAGDDYLVGSGVPEIFDLLAGNDWILPGTSFDRVEGGAGRDMVSYADQAGPVSAVQSASGIAVTGALLGDRLSGVEGVTGTGAGDRFFFTRARRGVSAGQTCSAPRAPVPASTMVAPG